jgi:formate hydrogenlyase transcriptional activator
VQTSWWHSIETGEPFEVEQRIRGVDGEYRWFVARGLPGRDPEGRIIRWYGMLFDIDERKQAEERLRRSEWNLLARTALEKALAEVHVLRDQLYKENIALRDEVDRVSMFEEIVGTSGALQAVVARVIKVAPSVVALDLTEVTLVEREAVSRLAICERNGFELRHCPAFLREWVAKERQRQAADNGGDV